MYTSRVIAPTHPGSESSSRFIMPPVPTNGIESGGNGRFWTNISQTSFGRTRYPCSLSYQRTWQLRHEVGRVPGHRGSAASLPDPTSYNIPHTDGRDPSTGRLPPVPSIHHDLPTAAH